MRRVVFIFILASSLFFGACQKTERQVTPAFYHWQTHLDLTDTEKQYLQKLNSKVLYAKFFDLDWDESLGEPVPLAQINIKNIGLDSIQLIPTIFITNRTFLRLEKEQVPDLTRRFYDKLFRLAEQWKGLPIEEIQIDCDWTAKSRVNYFFFLESFKKLIQEKNIRLSTTIRLHQVKYAKQTGIPPVDRGILMFYNVGNLEDWDATNTILTLEEALPYLDNLSDYPLTLDLALPIFSWGVLFRNNKMVKLINNLRPSDLWDTSRFLKIDTNRFRVIKSTYLNSRYLYQNDHIRTEYILVSTLQDCVQTLNQKLKNKNLTVAFYHLDTATIKHYPYEELEAIYTGFKN